MTELSSGASLSSLFASNREWSIGLHLAQQFHDRHGHSYIHPRLTVSGFPLGLWALSQRRSFRSGSLNPTRKRLIDAALEWDWCFSDREWEYGLYRMWECAVQQGHSLVPRDKRTEDGYPLGWWLSQQRLRHKRGHLPLPRVACLEQLPGWAWKPTDVKWNAYYALLHRFATKHGHVMVPSGYSMGGINLHAWYLNQRFLFNQHSDERQRKLMDLPGWKALGSNSDRWEAGLTHLESFAAEHGHVNVDGGHICLDGYPLGNWVGAQRRAYRLGKLTEERRERLDQVSHWEWTPSHTLWVDGYEHLVRYSEENGNADPPERFFSPNGFALGRWVTQQRAEHRAGNLPPDVVEKMEALPGWGWSKSTARWETALRRLVEFVEEHGRLPAQTYVCEDGFRLGTWVDTQRKFYRMGKTTPERMRRLEAWPWWRWEIRPPRRPKT